MFWSIFTDMFLTLLLLANRVCFIYFWVLIVEHVTPTRTQCNGLQLTLMLGMWVTHSQGIGRWNLVRVECVTIFSNQIAKSCESGIGYQVLADF